MDRLIFVKYSNERDSKFKIKTSILENADHKKIVCKEPIGEESKQHINNMLENYDRFEELFQDTKFKTNVCMKAPQGVYLEYLTGQSLSEILDAYLDDGDIDSFFHTVQLYVDELKSVYSRNIFHPSEEFKNIFGEVTLPENLLTGNLVNIDLIFHNIIVNDQWNVIDTEWSFRFDIPINFVIFRAIHYYLAESVHGEELLQYNLFKKYGISDMELNAYKKMEESFQKYICGNGISTYELRNEIGMEALPFEQADNGNFNRMPVVVYFDKGIGYTERGSINSFVEKKGEVYHFEIDVPRAAKRVRLDPADSKCILAVEKVVQIVDGNSFELEYVTNGAAADNYILYGTEDPQVSVNLKESGLGKLCIDYRIYLFNDEIGKNGFTKSIFDKDMEALEFRFKEDKRLLTELSRKAKDLEEYKNHIQSKLIYKLFAGSMKVLRGTKHFVRRAARAAFLKLGIIDGNRPIPEKIFWSLDSPNENLKTTYGVIVFEGWAFCYNDAISRIEICVNGEMFETYTGLSRDEVAEIYKHYGEYAVNAGFRFEYVEREHTDEYDIQVTLYSEKGVVEHKELFLMLENDSEGNYPTNIKRPMEPYDVWCIRNELTDNDREYINRDLSSMTDKPFISIVMPVYNPDELIFRKALDSVCGQMYDNWELIMMDDCSTREYVKTIAEEYCSKDKRIKYFCMQENSNISLATNAGVDKSSGEYIFLMDNDDIVADNALYEAAKVIISNPDADVIYSDDDKIDMDDNRFAPQFKPDFSPELLLSYMYFSHFFVIRKCLYEQVGGCRKGYEGAQDYDLALRLTEKTQKVYHIPKVLYHWRATPESTASSAGAKPLSVERGRQAVEDAINRRGIPAKAIIPEFARRAGIGIYALSPELKKEHKKKVSIIIPNKNHKELLARCVDSIKDKTTYKNYEIIIVDNGSTEKDIKSYYTKRKLNVVYIEDDEKGFNFSRMVNTGVNKATGDYVVLLNNDTEIITPEWLENMILYLTVTGVGIVGSRLLYDDNTIQHAGVLLGVLNGIAGHAFKNMSERDGGYLSYAKVARNYSAVTAACFMTYKKLYQEVGGFDEENFRISYNDVDFCLKIREKGYRIVYNPAVEIYHYEGKSRGVEQTGHFSAGQEEYNMKSRWLRTPSYVDPYYNPNLSKANESYDIDTVARCADFKAQINVLLISHNMNFEGAPLVQFNISKNLINRGYNVIALSPFDGPLAEEYRNIGIEVFVEEMNYLDYMECTEKINKLADIMREKNIQLIYANTLASYYGVLLAQKMNIPVVWNIHESTSIEKFFALGDDTLRRSVAQCFGIATKVIFVAEATKKLFMRYQAYNFDVIRNGIDFDQVELLKQSCDRASLRKEFNMSEDEVVISIFGTICHRKGQRLFLEAAKNIKERTNKKVRFMMVGAVESPYLDMIRSFIDKKNMGNYVDIVYSTKEVHKYYIASDIFVCASYEESSPLVILEAMTYKLPIVSTNVFGIPELVRNNNEALLIEAGNVAALEDSILELINNKTRSDRLVENAYYRARTFFTRGEMVDKYDELFQSAYFEQSNRVVEE